MYKKEVIKMVINEMFGGRITEVTQAEKEAGITDENPTKAANWNSDKKQGDEKAGFSGLYKRVQNKLKDDRINHAAIMRDLEWDGDDNTNRSLFEKKLKRADNDTGGKYEFTNDELKKILNSIETIGKN